MMDLYLQFGHGMMAHCRELLRSWGGGTVILSPRDLEPEQLRRFARDVTGISGGAVLFDPQFYVPDADHRRLCSYEYWPNEYGTSTFWSGTGLTSLLTQLRDLNREVGCRDFILPGLLATAVDDDWLSHESAVLEIATTLEDILPVRLTLALGEDAVRNQDQIHALLEEASNWNVFGYYIVCEHPNGDYLVQDPGWILNVLDLAAGLRLRGKHVILGYCTHQMLIATLAGVNAISSGTWMNVRSFPPEKFLAAYEDEIRQRSVWYYCPQVLSEYKLVFLDLAFRQHMLHLMVPPSRLGSHYADRLFEGSQPTTVGLPEQAAFRHYLHCLHSQVQMRTTASFDEATEQYEAELQSASDLLSELSRVGVTGQLRDFQAVLDACSASVRAFKNIRGPQLRRYWQDLNK